MTSAEKRDVAPSASGTLFVVVFLCWAEATSCFTMSPQVKFRMLAASTPHRASTRQCSLRQRTSIALRMEGENGVVRDVILDDADGIGEQLQNVGSPDGVGSEMQLVGHESFHENEDAAQKIIAAAMAEEPSLQKLSVIPAANVIPSTEENVAPPDPSSGDDVDCGSRLVGHEPFQKDDAAPKNLDAPMDEEQSLQNANVIPSTEENVGAVLAVSEAAVAAAEVALSTQSSGDIPDFAKFPVGDPQLTDFSDPGVDADTPRSSQQEIALNEESRGGSEAISPPSVGKILKFAIPAIGVWLCGPMLSLIDTSAVGLLSGTAQQAALSPAVSVTDYAALLTAFMYTATTNLVAAAQQTDQGVEGKPRTAKTLIASLQLSGFVGSGLCVVLLLSARFLLRFVIGNDAIDPQVFSAAMSYVRIRALGLPAAVILGSAQAACLGMQDIRSPLYVLLAAAIVNFCGDMFFVGSSNPFIGGAAGAAWATVFSQYAALAMFLKWLGSKPRCKSEVSSGQSVGEKPKVVNLTNAIMELTGPSNSKGSTRQKSFREALSSLHMSSSSSDGGAKRNKLARKIASLSNLLSRKKENEFKNEESDSFSTRGFLAGRFRKRDLLSLPPKDASKEFLPYVLPVSTTSAGRFSVFFTMSHVVSSSLGTTAMAAQQIVLAMFECLCPVADSLSLTAQSLVPPIFEAKKTPERAAALRQTSKNFLKAGVGFGAAMVGVVACIPFLSRFFSADPLVIAQVNSLVPHLAGVFAVHGMVLASEGVLLGQKDLGFMGRAYGAAFVLVPWLLLQVKKAALVGTRNVDVLSVWNIFLGYQLIRCATWVFRTKQLQDRIRKDDTPEVSAAFP